MDANSPGLCLDVMPLTNGWTEVVAAAHCDGVELESDVDFQWCTSQTNPDAVRSVPALTPHLLVWTIAGNGRSRFLSGTRICYVKTLNESSGKLWIKTWK
jgi:hypothetical protein